MAGNRNISLDQSSMNLLKTPSVEMACDLGIP